LKCFRRYNEEVMLSSAALSEHGADVPRRDAV